MMDRVGLDVVLDIEEHYCAEHPEYPEGPRRLLRRYLRGRPVGGQVRSGILRRLPRSPSPPIDSQSLKGSDVQ